MTDILKAIGALRLVPVIVIDEEENAYPLAQALKAGGLPCAEVTFRTAAAERSIRAMASDPRSSSERGPCSVPNRSTGPWKRVPATLSPRDSALR